MKSAASPDSTAQTAGEAAAQWLMREKAGRLAEPERAQLADWLDADPEHRAAYERACAAWEGVGRVAAHHAVRHMRDAALAAKPVRRFRGWQWLSAAAVVGVLVAAGWLFTAHRQPSIQSVSASAAGDSAMQIHHYQTAVGERSTVTLQDGSTVVLNTDSTVEVDFTPHERRVRLSRGQALFEVARNPSRAFVVLAGDRRVTALGTAFDVRLDRDRVRVVLVEGRVAVDMAAPPEANDAASSPSRLELEPGEQLVAQTGAPATVQSANIERLTSWKSGRLIFQDESLDSAVAEVNRYIREPLRVDDPRVAALRVSGVFRIAEVNRFAASMTELYPLEAHRQPDGSILLERRQGR
jgi:transmembrane sensor